jgi:hypothetical protein
MSSTGTNRAVAAVLGAFLAACGGQIGSPETVPPGNDSGPSTGPTTNEEASTGPFVFDSSIGPTGRDEASTGPSGFDGGFPGQPDVGGTSPTDATSLPDSSVPPFTDAGCAPTLPSGFAASPKGVATAACTAAQIAGTIQGCFLEGASDTSCEPYAQGPCWACIETPSTSANWGAYVEFTSDFYDDNYGGCIARLDPSPAGQMCGAAYAEFEQCLDQACVAACPPDESSTNPYQGLQTCENEASGADCSTYQDAEEVACASEGTVAQQCSTLLGYNGMTVDGGEAAQITPYITAICGVPTADGGVDGGS